MAQFLRSAMLVLMMLIASAVFSTSGWAASSKDKIDVVDVRHDVARNNDNGGNRGEREDKEKEHRKKCPSRPCPHDDDDDDHNNGEND